MNPYATEEQGIESVCDLFGSWQPIKKLETRKDFIGFFSEKTGYDPRRIAFKLTGIKDTSTFFYIKSVCDKALLEGTKENYRHAFNSVLFVPKESVPSCSFSNGQGG